MQKVSKEEKAKKELQERLKKSAQKHASSPLDSNPLIAQARAMLKPNFGIGSSSNDIRGVDFLEIESPKREIQGAESNPSKLRLENGFDTRPIKLAPSELASNELASNELASNELASNELASNELASNELASNELAPNELAPNELAPNELAPNELAPNELAPNELAPNELAPNELASHYVVTKNKTSTTRDENWVAAANALFSCPKVSTDLSRSEEWLQGYLMKTFGMKRYLPIKLCLEVYKKAQNGNFEIVCLNRQELAKALETGSNSSVSRAIKWGVEMGLFDCVSLTCRKGVLNAGTYFRIRSQWIFKV
jgi:hypothetical protein